MIDRCMIYSCFGISHSLPKADVLHSVDSETDIVCRNRLSSNSLLQFHIRYVFHIDKHFNCNSKLLCIYCSCFSKIFTVIITACEPISFLPACMSECSFQQVFCFAGSEILPVSVSRVKSLCMFSAAAPFAIYHTRILYNTYGHILPRSAGHSIDKLQNLFHMC